MPELPEVETVRTAMDCHLVGRTILSVQSSSKRLREPLPRKRLSKLAGSRFVAAKRRAKFLLLQLDNEMVLVVHLGMTGNLLFRNERQTHDHVVFNLDDGPPLVFSDPRRFGMMLALLPHELEKCQYLRKLGVEPLEGDFDGDHLYTYCRGRTRPIKSLLLDSRIVVGVGNIYASEALFRARIRPTTRCKRLSRIRCSVLAEKTIEVLTDAISEGGTTISDYLGSATGGRFQQHLAVYGRTGEECFLCKQPIRKITLAGRSSFYCSNCQK